jgi:hypothetical protein
MTEQLATARKPASRAVLHLVTSRRAEAATHGPMSDRHGKLFKCDREAQAYRFVDGQLVVPSSKVLHQCVAREYHPGAVVLLQASHGSQPCLETTVIGLHPVVGVPIGPVPRPPQTRRRRSPRHVTWHRLGGLASPPPDRIRTRDVVQQRRGQDVAIHLGRGHPISSALGDQTDLACWPLYGARGSAPLFVRAGNGGYWSGRAGRLGGGGG